MRAEQLFWSRQEQRLLLSVFVCVVLGRVRSNQMGRNDGLTCRLGELIDFNLPWRMMVLGWVVLFPFLVPLTTGFVHLLEEHRTQILVGDCLIAIVGVWRFSVSFLLFYFLLDVWVLVQFGFGVIGGSSFSFFDVLLVSLFCCCRMAWAFIFGKMFILLFWVLCF